MNRVLIIGALWVVACGAPESRPSGEQRSGLGAVANAGECPRDWATARSRCDSGPGSGCAPIGLRCWYPGMGDWLRPGQWADALLGCFEPSGGTSTTAAGEWRCAQ